MHLRKLLSLFAAAFAMAAFAPLAGAQSPNYEVLTPAQPHETDKVEVTEFFWYGCPHCYALEPYINAWLKTKPQDVIFKRVPTYNEGWAPMVVLYYTLEAMGLADQYHQKVFDALHKYNVNLNNAKKRDEWLKANGIDPAKYAEVEKSFTVATKVQRAKQLTQAYKVDGVPRLFVNGKYFTSPEHAGSAERTFLVVDQLVAMARKENAAAPKPKS